ncbi:hypothetical protein [Pontibacter actiniarum]|uniref:Uncharacterized protein n=1 Tax=Pontibacter actiniarum TaxID=323450 RepID=A0A1X9YMB0_9BACT|nr:hypothetical protein [Pontibacter actiniarum]ARS34002.1 hypothetical protein CA264_00305 [Pontibacter actiniarum]
MKRALSIILPYLLVQLCTALLASGGAILYAFTELPGLVLLGLFLLFQLGTYVLVRGVESAVQPGQGRWLRALQQVVGSAFIVTLLIILAVVCWIVFEYSIWRLSGNGELGYTLHLEHVVVSVVPQVAEVLVLGEVLRQAWQWLLYRPWAGQRLTASD